MAKISVESNESVYTIKSWLGLNESPDGDSEIKPGQASSMRNFRVTKEGNLQIRPGYASMCTISAGKPVRGMWCGDVGSAKKLVTACNGHLYSHNLTTFAATDLGALTDAETFFFAFNSKLYILNGKEYKVWDGTTLADVAGYVPITFIACAPTGGGASLQDVNKLTGSKIQWFSSLSNSVTYQLVETAIDSVDKVWVNDVLKTATTHYTVNLTAGTVTLLSAPGVGTNDVKIQYTKGTGDRTTILNNKFAEMFNGATDNRIFVYGDGTNKAYYTGIEHVTGLPTAEYFPDLNVLDAGESNTQISGMVRHFNNLFVQKKDGGSFLIDFDYITLEDGRVTAAFYTKAIDKEMGNDAIGQIGFVNNYPISLQGKSAYRWNIVYSSGTQDERVAKLISAPVEVTLGAFTFSSAKTFDDEYNKEFWIVNSDGKALIYSYANETDGKGYRDNLWFKYTNIPATCLVSIDGTMYFGTTSGLLMKFSSVYKSDAGTAIDAYWESGAMDFGASHLRKNVTKHYVLMRPESTGQLSVTLSTDRGTTFETKTITLAASTYPAKPNLIKLKAKKFTHLKLILSSNSTTATATILSYAMVFIVGGYSK